MTDLLRWLAPEASGWMFHPVFLTICAVLGIYNLLKGDR